MRKNILITTGGSGGHVIPATIIYEHLKDKYAVEEVIFHALKTIDGDWFDDQVDDILNDLYIGDKTIH